MRTPGPVPDDGARHGSNAVILQVILLVRNRLGDEGVARLLELAGETRPLTELEDLTGWSSYWQLRHLLEAAAVALGGTEELRDVGDDYVRTQAPGEVISLLQALGSPGEVLRSIAQTAGKFSTVIRMEPLDIGPGHGVVWAEAVEGFPRYPELCDYTAGLLATSPLIFGLPRGEVTETQCQTRGDDRCVFEVQWDESSADATDPARRAMHLETELASALGRLESLTATVGDLVSGDDLDTVLAKITEQAAVAVRAPSYLLAVRPTDESEIRVHQRGIGDDDLDGLVADLLVDRPDGHRGSRLIADVVSAQRHYGRLAAINPDSVRFFPGELPVLTAYAKLAAVALDSATTLKESRRQAATASALLSLARSLAGVGTTRDMAQRIASCVPAIVDCDRAIVLLWDEEHRSLHFGASYGYPPDVDAEWSELTITAGEMPTLDDLLRHREPVFYDSLDTRDEMLQAFMERSRSVAGVSVPITADGRFLGLVTAAVTAHGDRLRRDPHLLDRLTGLADHASTALRNAELIERIQHQAMHDALTGLPNQRLLEDRVTNALGQARRSEELVALLFLDLDRFKNVNDSLGHASGDELLRQVAARLGRTVRQGDTVARLGGDEFAILLPRVDSRDGVDEVVERILSELRRPFSIGAHHLFVSGSIGIAAFPASGDDFQSLMQSADAAMFRAKSAGRATYRWYSPTAVGTSYSALTLEADLHRAIERDQLFLMFQPQVDLESLQIIGAEALVRWNHHVLGLLSPADFIPLAEETALITDIDEWVLREACRETRRLQRAGLPAIQIAVNVSNRDLRNPALLEVISRVLDDTGLSPCALELEVTEQVAHSDRDELTVMLDKLSELGVRLAVDDFGTGHSTLTRLATGHFDTLKIDRSFIQEINSPDDDVPLVSAVISLGRALGTRVVAEGVETDAQVHYLRRHGCEAAQGYFFSPPVEIDRFERQLGATGPHWLTSQDAGEEAEEEEV